MDGTYAVFLGREKVGQAVVEKRGLYYQFQCHCKLHSAVMCRVVVSCAGGDENLGILVPDGDDYILSKKLPAKKFSSGRPEFRLEPKQSCVHEISVDIYPEEPFRYIAKLEKAYLDKRRGKHAIVIHTD